MCLWGRYTATPPTCVMPLLFFRSPLLRAPEKPDLSRSRQCATNWRRCSAKCHLSHQPHDCVIDLLPGTAPSKSRLYSLPESEHEAMETHINNSLAAGLIRPSLSPAGAGFSFVEKKDMSLRPCIDYKGLNDITVKNQYPLPLISFAFEILQGATIFSKLDLRNADHLVWIWEGDKWKIPLQHPGWAL